MSNDHSSKSEPERPAYSPDLHARVMAEIASLGNSIAANEPLPKQRRARWATVKWSAIAAGLLIAAIGINQSRRTSDDSLPPAHPSNRSRDLAAISKPLPPDFSFDKFNHNAGLAIRLVVDQLPIDVPADDWGLPAVE